VAVVIQHVALGEDVPAPAREMDTNLEASSNELTARMCQTNRVASFPDTLRLSGAGGALLASK
jgi:hypothetical protein